MTEKAVYFWITIALCIFVAILFFASRRKFVVEKGVTVYYQATCAAVFTWLFFTLFLYTDMPIEIAYELAMWRYLGIAFMPVMMTLHIWQQLSHSPLSQKHVALCCIPPAFSFLLAVTNRYTSFFIKGYSLVDPVTGLGIYFDNNWGFYLHCVISYVAVLISVILILRILTVAELNSPPSTLAKLMVLISASAPNIPSISSIV